MYDEAGETLEDDTPPADQISSELARADSVVQSQPGRESGEPVGVAQTAEKSFQKANYGLRREILSNH
jgi:hypothetical protein